MKVAIIPARGGSRRIPKKNIRPFHGLPIIAYSIKTAQASGLFDGIYVSTDDDEIADVAKLYGAAVMRRLDYFAQDEVGTQAVMRHALITMIEQSGNYRYTDLESACCIYATAPMLLPQDLIDGYRAMKKRVARYAFSVGYPPLRDAGCYYCGLAHSFINGDPLVGPETVVMPLPAKRVMDINTMADWEQAERMYAALQEKA